MKRALVKDSVKQIKNTLKRFISILMMAFLGVGFFAGIKATSPDMVDTIDRYYKEQNIYDLEIVSTLGLTNDDLNEIAKIDGIDQVEGTYEKDAIIENDNEEIVVKLLCANNINVPVVLEGNLPINEDECVVEESFLKTKNKKIGDYIDLKVEDSTNDNGDKVNYLKQNKLKIVGTVKSPLYISRNRGTSNLGSGSVDYFMYISDKNINANDIYTRIYAKVKNSNEYTTSTDEYENYIDNITDNVEKIKDQREQARHNQLITSATNKLNDAEKELIDAKSKIADIESPKWYIFDRYNNDGYNSYIQDTHSIKNLGNVFPIVFFIVATLISLNSMTRMVEEQRTQIGTLKALGYNKFQIISKYVIYAALATVIGGILGMCVGFVLIPTIIFKMYQMMYQISGFKAEFNMFYGMLGLGLISICIIGATIYSALKELVNTPATLMRPKSPKIGKRVLLEHIPFIWKRLSFTRKVTVRNIFRYKKRFLMTIIGILGCTALIVTGFGIKNTIKSIIPLEYENVFNYDMQITLKSGNDENQKDEYIQELKNKDEIEKVVATYMTSVTAQKDDKSESLIMIVPDDENKLEGLINIKDVKTKNQVSLKENEICITDKVAQLLNVKQGDTIKIKDSDDNEIDVKVANIVENYVYHYAYMSKQTYQNLFKKDYSTNILFTKNKELSEEKINELSKAIMNDNEVSGVSVISNLTSQIDNMMSSLNYVVIILIVSAGLLAFVVLYNLQNVNISERIRELATIKVLGFYDKEVYSYVARETILLTIIGTILGLIGGYFLNAFILKTCEINMLRFKPTIEPISYIYAIALTTGFSIIVNIATYFALKKIDMIESLKSVE